MSLAQLRELGLSPSGVRSRVRRGQLHHVHRGVYAVGHALLPWHGQVMAAVLACGNRAVASHGTAAALSDLMARGNVVDVTVATGAGRSRAGIRAHEGRLLRKDVVVVDGIRCTSVARTILDLADHLDMRGLERLVDQAEVMRVFDMRAMEDVLARANGRAGVAKVRAVLALEHEPAFTKSHMEELVLVLCDDHRLPRPLTNEYAEGELVDFQWPAERVIMEADSKRWHGTTRRRERDIARDRRLQLRGWRVLRFSYQSIAHRPAEVAAELRAFLTAPGARRSAS